MNEHITEVDEYVKADVAGDFRRELAALINRYSQENSSNTPDFILAQYLLGCFMAWNQAVQQREKWYGRKAAPGVLS